MEKFTKRANKIQSKKRIFATRYLGNNRANELLKNVLQVDSLVENIMYTLVCYALSKNGLIEKQHVQLFLQKYSHLKQVSIDIQEGVWDSEDDVLGFVYQSLLTEGERNITGQYYTSKNVVKYIVGDKVLSSNEIFLDPCCGSGAFLMAIKTSNPSNLYGFDINQIAVMIVSANLLIKYKDKEFCPHVYCLDFLKGLDYQNELPQKFDNIYTNPPWGSDKKGLYIKNYPFIKSKERASMVIVESLKQLKDNGTLYFLLPTSLLKIKSHNDIRKYILSNTTIHQIDIFKDRFDSVFTDYFSIKLSNNKTKKQSYIVTSDKGSSIVTLQDYNLGNIAIENLCMLDKSIISKMESLCNDKLSHSTFALGIVTGDNKNKVKKEMAEGLEPIYTGKDVKPFKLKDES